MKSVLLLLTFITLFTSNTHAQTLVLSAQPVRKEFSDHPLPGFREHPRPPKICPVSIVGISLDIVGPIVIIAGFSSELNGSMHGIVTDQSAIDKGHVLEYAGLGMLVVGIGMSIGGGIHDHMKVRQSKLGIIAPKKNEIGLAYNF